MSYAMMQALRTPDLTPSEQCIFAYLVGRANGARVCWERITVIQTELHIKTRHTICSATRKLVKMGRLAVKRRMRLENSYTILDPDGWLYERPEPCAQKSTHQPVDNPAPSEQKPAHQTPEGRAKNHTTEVQKTAQESSFKNPSRQERAQVFSDSRLAASQPAEPDPKPAQIIEARRQEHAATKAALPEQLAEALGRLASGISGKAYAPGRVTSFTTNEQKAVLAPRVVRTKHLTPEQLALARAISGIRTVPVAAYQGASP